MPEVHVQEVCSDRPESYAELEHTLKHNDYDLYVAAGGDGSVSSLLTLYLDHQKSGALAIIPLGTGNNLARSLGIPADPFAAWNSIDRKASSEVSVLTVQTDERRYYCLNLVSVGISSEITNALDESEKEFWRSLAYVRGVLNVTDKLKTYSFTLQLDTEPPKEVDVFNALFCNGPFAGNGFLIQPDATLDDGYIHTVLVEESSIPELSAVLANVATGKGVSGDTVHAKRAYRVHIQSETPLPLSIDGEILSSCSITLEESNHQVTFLGGRSPA